MLTVVRPDSVQWLGPQPRRVSAGGRLDGKDQSTEAPPWGRLGTADPFVRVLLGPTRGTGSRAWRDEDSRAGAARLIPFGALGDIIRL